MFERRVLTIDELKELLAGRIVHINGTEVLLEEVGHYSLIDTLEEMAVKL